MPAVASLPTLPARRALPRFSSDDWTKVGTHRPTQTGTTHLFGKLWDPHRGSAQDAISTGRIRPAISRAPADQTPIAVPPLSRGVSCSQNATRKQNSEQIVMVLFRGNACVLKIIDPATWPGQRDCSSLSSFVPRDLLHRWRMGGRRCFRELIPQLQLVRISGLSWGRGAELLTSSQRLCSPRSRCDCGEVPSRTLRPREHLHSLSRLLASEHAQRPARRNKGSDTSYHIRPASGLSP